MSKSSTNKTYFVTGDFIPLSNVENKTDKKTLMDGINNVFSKTLDRMNEGLAAANDGNITRTASKGEDLDIQNALLPKFFREAQDIKDNNWEQVSKSNRLSDNGVSDFRAVSSARSKEESNFSGRGHLKGALASIFNPTALEDVRNDKYTDVVISDSKRKKIEAEAKKEKNRDWENVTAAANSKNINPTQMGFTPSRTAWQPVELETVKISEVEDIKKSNAKSAEAGTKAAEIKSDLDKVFASKWEKDLNDKRNWEEIEHEKIASNQEREISVQESTIKIAEDFVKPTLAEGDLSGLFKLKNDPEQYKEADIKRDSSILGKRRAKREDDRSWESVSNAKSKKY